MYQEESSIPILCIDEYYASQSGWSGTYRDSATPPGKKSGKVNPVTLTAAHLAGATEVYKIGGALGKSRFGVWNRIYSKSR